MKLKKIKLNNNLLIQILNKNNSLKVRANMFLLKLIKMITIMKGNNIAKIGIKFKMLSNIKLNKYFRNICKA